jgi:flagellar assembly factor FliW
MQKLEIEVNSVAQIETSRFGTLTYNEEDLLFFPRGIPGFSTLLHWVVSGEEENPVKWLQSVDDSQVALPITAPHLVFPDYNAVITKDELEELENPATEHLIILVVLTIPPEKPWDMTANLRAPIVINTVNRRGKQILLNEEDYPIRFYCFSEEKRAFFAETAARNRAAEAEGEGISASPASAGSEGNGS